MSSSDNRPAADATLHDMIQIAYDAALDHTKFDKLLETWDAFHAKAQDPESMALIEKHFEQARALATDPRLDTSFEIDIILSAVGAPALLLDKNGIVLAANADARDLLPDLETGARYEAALSKGWPPTDTSGDVHRLTTKDGAELLAAVQQILLQAEPGFLYLVKFEMPRWTASIQRILRHKYTLTATEIGVAALMQKGMSASEIATARGRSLETVRTQIKAVLRKCGTARRGEFVKLLATLQQLLDDRDTAEIAARVSSPEARVRAIEMPGGKSLLYSTYGAPNGLPVLYFTSSSRPEESASWRRAVSENGLAIIAPHRFGFGGSTDLGAGEGMAGEMAKGCLQILKDFDISKIVLAGHREGGVLAAQVADRVSNDLNVAAVCLISTGAPKTSMAAFEGSPDNIVRSLIAAHKMPSALELGYRAASRIFHSGKLGEKQIISYFFRGSPIDTALIKHPDMYDIVRHNLSYSFENCRQIVKDIALWTSPWDADLTHQCRHNFVLGDQHDFFDAASLAEYCSRSSRRSHTILQDAGQMAMYVHSERVAQDILELFDFNEAEAS